MNEEIFSDIGIERAALAQFGVSFDIKQVVVRDMPTGVSTRATIFMTTKNQLYVYIAGEAPLVLADVKKLIGRIGLVADMYLPPVDEPNYFDRVGREKFIEVFPSRRPLHDDDISYYRTLAPYNPGLVKIARVKNGQVLGYDLDAHDWRKVAELSYSKIKTA
ncbi:MAG TPA: hypothetical protein VH144_03700 [Candidatus Saccharimonadales bacterium]|nr:hypothetical protein [Candidatus Saccharimonadales bacterium]